MPRTTQAKNALGATIRQAILITGLLIAVPLLFYPKGFGFPSFDLNPAVGLLEWVFYAAVLSISTSRLPFSTRVVAGGFTVIYRLLVAVVSGSLVSVAQNQPWSPTVVEMMWSYPLALIPQVLAAAVTLTPMWEQIFDTRPAAPARRPRTVITRTGTHTLAPAVSVTAAASRVAGGTARAIEPSLDDAVSYVGDYHGVRLCWIVDGDGLPLAVWQRQQYSGDADFWAPVCVEMVDFHRRRLSNGSAPCEPDRLEVRTNQGRLIVEAVGDFWLGVLTEPDTDELVSVRIARAREMITRHLQEHGGRTATVGEAEYV